MCIVNKKPANSWESIDRNRKKILEKRILWLNNHCRRILSRLRKNSDKKRRVFIGLRSNDFAWHHISWFGPRSLHLYVHFRFTEHEARALYKITLFHLPVIVKWRKRKRLMVISRWEEEKRKKGTSLRQISDDTEQKNRCVTPPPTYPE